MKFLSRMRCVARPVLRGLGAGNGPLATRQGGARKASSLLYRDGEFMLRNVGGSKKLPAKLIKRFVI